MIPLIAIVGGGLDTSRIYIVKSRMQQACDASVLAARKSMNGVLWTSENEGIGRRFFEANFPDGKMGTMPTRLSFSHDGDGKVRLDAATQVPMSLMQIFGKQDADVAVACEATLQIPNTDVMMVLDTTGSMNFTNPQDKVTRIEALRSAVTSFHDTLTKAQAGSKAVIRYGFVPYANNVNVGHLLRREWMVDYWTYQSRAPGGRSGSTYYWTYKPVTYDVRPLKGTRADGYMEGGSITAPIGDRHTNRTISWAGCIEERDTVKGTDYSNALDMDIDAIPTVDPRTQWRPAMGDLIFHRTGWYSYNDAPLYTAANYVNVGDYLNGAYAACPSRAMKLQPIAAATLKNYLNGLQPGGSTHHDIGLIWGARLISPNGLFAKENATTADGAPISRHMIFMTDGQVATMPIVYDAYGWPALDMRRSTSRPTVASQDATVEARTKVMCERIKQKGITLWVIAFGTELTSLLSDCASSGRAFVASNASQLEENFQKIATKVANLRITN